MVLFKCFLEILLLDWLFLEIPLLDTCFFFYYVVPYNHHSFHTVNQRYSKMVNCLKLLQALVLLLCHFVMNLNMQIISPDWSATYCWQVLTGKHFHRKGTTNPKVNMILLAALFPSVPSPASFKLPSTAPLFLEAPPWCFLCKSVQVKCVEVVKSGHFETLLCPLLTLPTKNSILLSLSVSSAQLFFRASSLNHLVQIHPHHALSTLHLQSFSLRFSLYNVILLNAHQAAHEPQESKTWKLEI